MSNSTNPSGSLADRISKPLDGSSSTFTHSSEAPGASSWADEVSSPVGTTPKDRSTVSDAQTDGAVEPLGGSGLHDAQYEVEVKLSDIQGDESSPLFSVSTFEELGM